MQSVNLSHLSTSFYEPFYPLWEQRAVGSHPSAPTILPFPISSHIAERGRSDFPGVILLPTGLPDSGEHPVCSWPPVFPFADFWRASMFGMLIGARMQLVFRYSIVLLIGALLFWAAMYLLDAHALVDHSGTGTAITLLGGVLGVAGPLALSILWFGMTLTAILSPQHATGTKVAWVAFLLIGNAIAALIYYLAVYVRYEPKIHSLAT